MRYRRVKTMLTLGTVCAISYAFSFVQCAAQDGVYFKAGEDTEYYSRRREFSYANGVGHTPHRCAEDRFGRGLTLESENGWRASSTLFAYKTDPATVEYLVSFSASRPDGFGAPETYPIEMWGDAYIQAEVHSNRASYFLPVNGKLLHDIVRLKTLRGIRFYACELLPDALIDVAKLADVKEIHFHHASTPAETLEPLAASGIELVMVRNEWPEHLASMVGRMPRLHEVIAISSGLTDAELTEISSSQTLTSLALIHCAFPRDRGDSGSWDRMDGLTATGRMAHLQELDLQFCEAKMSGRLGFIGQNVELRRVHFGNSFLDAEDIAVLRACPKLEYVGFSCAKLSPVIRGRLDALELLSKADVYVEDENDKEIPRQMKTSRGGVINVLRYPQQKPG